MTQERIPSGCLPMPNGTVTTVLNHGLQETITILQSRPIFTDGWFDGWAYRVQLDDVRAWVATNVLPEHWEDWER